MEATRLEREVVRATSLTPSFGIELINARFSDLNAEISRTATENTLIDHEFCQIAFADVPKLAADFRHLRKAINANRRQVFVLRLNDLARQVENSRLSILWCEEKIAREYLRPREAARNKVDRVLDVTGKMMQEYAELQAFPQRALKTISSIKSQCSDLFTAPFPHEIQRLFGRYHHVFSQDGQNLRAALHYHRSRWRTRKYLDHPLRECQIWKTQNFTQVAQARKCFTSGPDAIKCIALGYESNKWVAQRLDLQSRAASHYLREVYKKAQKRSRRPESNLHALQLDVLAPFWFLHILISRLMNDVWHLIDSLNGKLGSLWPFIPVERQYRRADELGDWTAKFLTHRNEFFRQADELEHINWLRLISKERLRKMRQPDPVEQQGLFVAPNLLSHDPARFEQWANRMSQAFFDSWILKQAIELGVKEWSIIFAAVEGQKRHVARVSLDLGSARHESAKQGRKKPGSNRHVSKKTSKLSRSGSSRFARPKREQSRSTLAHNTKSKRQQKSTDPSKDSLSSIQPKSRAEMKAPVDSPPKSDALKAKASPAPGENPQSKFWQPKPVWGKPQHQRPYSTDATLDHDGPRGCSRVKPEIPLIRLATDACPAKQMVDHASLQEPNTSAGTDPSAKETATPQFWSHHLHRRPDGQKLTVHYCRSRRTTEAVAQRFLNSEVIGFDMEWKAQASGFDSIQNNLSLIQVANEERIALFQISLFKPARTQDDFVAPSLKRLLESPDVMKVGVSIKADSTRLRKYLGIEARAIFELSHLYKLVKHGLVNPKLVNKRSVNLSEQVEEHFGLPLEKTDDVRCGDWARALNYRQIQYAATDPYACHALFHAMELKRLAMDPVPPRPAHAELNLPILLSRGEEVKNDENNNTEPLKVSAEASLDVVNSSNGPSSSST
ncbi:hypothetical protein NUU61_006959 [Penicillium alfredii]|uniref:3'-5' exonuclease domain-containing protein n=1 Tax=Penicillium alfredii TaxID=1506179 RepID=A0A9W9F1Y0_9EURO|nr:uncharacterized protein NUU61_006959 [Penicillium alfredii]KAJ5092089.1 hypothetical protein NUU61_006959 [Penicillium alfredii]